MASGCMFQKSNLVNKGLLTTKPSPQYFWLGSMEMHVIAKSRCLQKESIINRRKAKCSQNVAHHCTTQFFTLQVCFLYNIA